MHREACARDYSRADAAAAIPAVPAKDDDTDAGSDDAVVGSDDIVDDADAAPSAVEMERLWRCEIRESLPGLSVGELKELCRDNSLRVGGNKMELQSRLGDSLALQDDLYDGVPAPSGDVDDEDGEVVEAFGMTAHAQHHYPPRDPADKRPQVERDMVVLLAAQQRELDDLHADHATRCTLLRLPPISATLTTAVRADPPQLNAAWLNKKGHLAQYIGLPGPFARTCRLLRALPPLHIGEDCQSSWQGDLLTPLDCALLTKMWLHTGKTMGMLATDVDVPEAVLAGVIRTWLPLWGAVAKVLLRLWLDFDYVVDCMPAGDAADSIQAELQGAPVSGMPDGKDFETDRWNRNPLLRRRLTCVYGCGRGGGDCAVAVVAVVAVVLADCCLYCSALLLSLLLLLLRYWCCWQVQQQVARCGVDNHRVGIADWPDRARVRCVPWPCQRRHHGPGTRTVAAGLRRWNVHSG